VPVPLNVTTVRSQNDLKPRISTLRSLSKVSPFVMYFYFAAAPTRAATNLISSETGFLGRGERQQVAPRRESVPATLPSVTDRKHKRLAGSQSEPSRLALRWRYGKKD
jgi:hypothetical protein